MKAITVQPMAAGGAQLTIRGYPRGRRAVTVCERMSRLWKEDMAGPPQGKARLVLGS